LFFMIQNQAFRIDTLQLFPFCNIDVICIHKDNLDKYSFANVECLRKEFIDGIAKHMCSVSNDDCKSYFKSIGVVV
jgi:hypothetical protein